MSWAIECQDTLSGAWAPVRLTRDGVPVTFNTRRDAESYRYDAWPMAGRNAKYRYVLASSAHSAATFNAGPL